MGNKTTWKTGQSGNPSGRPPRSRALTDLLIAAGKTKVVDADGRPIPRNRLLADMIWLAVTAGQVEFLAENRGYDAHGLIARTRVSEFAARDWFEVVKWLYAQIDGDLSVHYDDRGSGDDDDGPTGEADSNSVVILPDNGRSVQRPDDTPTPEPTPEAPQEPHVESPSSPEEPEKQEA